MDSGGGKLILCEETPIEVLNSDPNVEELISNKNTENINKIENNNNHNNVNDTSNAINNNNEEIPNENTTNSNITKQEQITTTEKDDKKYIALPSASNAQTLSQDEIMNIKKQGLSSSHLVQSLVKNSATFKDRTEWSKKKYVLKKRKRHAEIWWVVKPTPASLGEHYFTTKSDKIWYVCFLSVCFCVCFCVLY
jgi:hypothetical protein